MITKTIKSAIMAVLLAACIYLMAACDLSPNPAEPIPQSFLLKDVYSEYFSVGAAAQSGGIKNFTELLPHFNSITAETEMKWSRLEATQGKFTYKGADEIIDWAKNNDAKVRGHCLVWYKSLPSWVLSKGTTKAQALDKMDSHIDSAMEHFGNNVYCWDVLNEALQDTVTAQEVSEGNIWRTGNISGSDAGDWYELCGKDYVKQSFISADKARKKYGLKDVELFYNDYSLNSPSKRDACVQLVKMLQKDGIAIDGIGMQAHYRLTRYLADRKGFMKNFEDSIKAFTELGLDVHLTELDIRVYENADDPQIFDALPIELEQQQAEMYSDIFSICRKYSKPWKEGAGRVSNVTTWGIADSHNAWNTPTHKEFPLIFGMDKKYKKAYYEVTTF